MNIEKVIQSEDTDSIISDILCRIHTDGPVYLEDMETLSYIKKFHNQVFSKYEKRLMSLLGLFYKTTEPANLIESVYAIYAQEIKDDTGRDFTPVQASAYKHIYEKKYFSFSAPTSSGKSYLFRELIQEARKDIVIVLPSRALIAEYMFLVKRIVDKSVLVLQFIENVNKAKTQRRVYIITPERGEELFKFIPQLDIELFLFDEAQISEEHIRGLRFDSFVRRVDKLLPNTKKVFTHPFIENPEAQLQKHNFNNNSDYQCYHQSSVGKIFICTENDKYYYFSPYEKKTATVEVSEEVISPILTNNGTVLIYISKDAIYKGQYKQDFEKYIKLCPVITDSNALNIIEELRDYIGATKTHGEKYSSLVDLMRQGIVIHHGSMPLKARLLVEKFVNENYAKICFATSTLIQGINMPFDVVFIDNFRFQGGDNEKILGLKNLIGRAGRSTNKKNSFEYGYVIINKKSVKTFSKRMIDTVTLKNTSSLDDDLSMVDDDSKDIVLAIQNDSFNTEMQLPNIQVERLSTASILNDVKFILDSFLTNKKPLTGTDYQNLPKVKKQKIKDAFRSIYTSHVRRKDLVQGEMGVLATSIPIILWRIQGKSFKEIISLRHAYISQRDIRRDIESRLKRNQITEKQALEEYQKLPAKFSPVATQLPNKKAKHVPLFKNISVLDIDYDTLVYDTYDYIDKVISLSLTDPFCGAFQIYFNQTNDERALAMKNYIRYGTNDNIEIWLMKYGFDFEDIEWIKALVVHVDENQIIFSESIGEIDENKKTIIERYL